MGIRLLQSHSDFLALKQSWEAVYRCDEEAHYFVSWQWLSSFYEQDSESICILAFENDSDSNPPIYGAFLPLKLQLRLSANKGELYNSYCMGGNNWADYTGIVCLPELERVAIPAFSKFLRKMLWRRLHLKSICMSDRRLQLLLGAFKNDDYKIGDEQSTDNGGATNLDKAPGINLPKSYDEYLTHHVSSNTRQKIRRFQRKVDADPGLQIQVSPPENYEHYLEYFEKYWSERWATAKGDRVNDLASKYSEFIRNALQAGDMFMPVLLNNNIPVSMLACYVDRCRKSVLFFVGARDAEFDKLASGLVLHATAIEWAIGQGYRYYDFLRGDESYKYTLGARDQLIRNVVVTAYKIKIDAEFLDGQGIESALALVSRFQITGSRSSVSQLYRQMLESWPNDFRVLRQYSSWLSSMGYDNHSAFITTYLNVDQ
ncbi:MAG: hypothetical protein ACJAY2_003987 [Pseudomonadales bacterium]|jgi:hypothetical protein